MTDTVDRPHVTLTMEGTDPTELHATLLSALATQAGSFHELLTTGAVSKDRLLDDVRRLIDAAEYNNPPAAWRFIQTEHRYLGPSFFVITGRDVVATSGRSTVVVTRNGFEFSCPDQEAVEFRAVEVTKTRASLITAAGEEVASYGPDQVHLARDLSGGHPYVTAVPSDFRMATQQPLYRLQGLLGSASGDSVLAF